MSNIDHILLYLILFGFSFIWSNAQQQNKKQLGIVFAILYIFIIGSRTWGPDYDWYYYKIVHPNDLTVKEDEIGFQWLNTCIRFIGLDGYGAFYVYALILMIGVVSIINSYKDNWQFMCLLLIPSVMGQTSTLIRQGIAFSFALISFYFLRKNKIILSIFFVFVAFFIHKIIIVLFLFYFIALFLSKKKISITIIIVAYIFATFIPPVLDVSALSHYLSLINIGGKYENYIDSSDIWLSTEANIKEWRQSTIALILSFLYNISMFIVVDLYLKKQENKEIRTLFYVFVIGAIFYRYFFLNELLRRIFELLYIVYFIPTGYALSYISCKRHCLSKKENNLFKLCLCAMFLYLALYWGRFIFANEDCNFLWT